MIDKSILNYVKFNILFRSWLTIIYKRRKIEKFITFNICNNTLLDKHYNKMANQAIQANLQVPKKVSKKISLNKLMIGGCY